MKPALKSAAPTKRETIRTVEDVTSFGFSPSRLMPGTDRDGYMPDAREPSRKEVELVRQWLREVGTRTKTIRRKRDSYGLRSDVVQWYADRGDNVYVSNGAVIAACLLEGYSAVRCRKDAPNAYFDLSVPRVKR